MPSVLRSVAVFSFVSVVALMSAPGCSQQGEGERCDDAKNGDLDCDDGLVCIKASQLNNSPTDRCCPVSETDRTGLCTPSGVDNTPDPVGGAGGEAAGGASAGQNAGGAPGASGSGTGGTAGQGGANGGVPSVDGGAPPAAGATTGGAGNPSSGGQGGAD